MSKLLILILLICFNCHSKIYAQKLNWGLSIETNYTSSGSFERSAPNVAIKVNPLQSFGAGFGMGLGLPIYWKISATSDYFINSGLSLQYRRYAFNTSNTYDSLYYLTAYLPLPNNQEYKSYMSKLEFEIPFLFGRNFRFNDSPWGLSLSSGLILRMQLYERNKQVGLNESETISKGFQFQFPQGGFVYGGIDLSYSTTKYQYSFGPAIRYNVFFNSIEETLNKPASISTYSIRLVWMKL
jgi:hypothetical protein